MTNFNLISSAELKPVLVKLMNDLLQMQRDYITNQKEVNGGAFPALKRSTIAGKTGLTVFYTRNGKVFAFNKPMGKSLARASNTAMYTAGMRMMRTRDYLRNAYIGSVNDNSVSISISNSPYKSKAIWEERLKYLERMKANPNKKYKPPKPIPNYTYQNIHDWNARGEYDNGKRSSRNLGAAMFGISKPNLDIKEQQFIKTITPVLLRNIDKILMDSIKNA